jgi:glycosyltransferase involved in cell wall biosynthesis
MSKPLSGKRILALPKYAENGASSRLRTLQYIPWLHAAGAQVSVDSFFDDAYVDRLYAGKKKGVGDAIGPYARRIAAVLQSRSYDMVWLEKELFPYLPGVFERTLRIAGVPYVADYDDAVFHNYDTHSSRLVRAILGRKLDPLLRGASMVTAGNAYLADYASAHGARRTEFLPTVIDLDRYPLHPAPGGHPVRIGWIGTPTTAKYLIAILPQLAAAAKEHAICLVTIGAPPIDPPAGLMMEQHSWTEASEASLLSGVDIGIMPLPDEPFERGKCGYKLIQYMACGRPVIASPVGVNTQIVTPDTGLHAGDPAQWQAAITMLCSDVIVRNQMGAAGRRKVENSYSIQSTAPRLIDLFAEIMTP